MTRSFPCPFPSLLPSPALFNGEPTNRNLQIDTDGRGGLLFGDPVTENHVERVGQQSQFAKARSGKETDSSVKRRRRELFPTEDEPIRRILRLGGGGGGDAVPAVDERTHSRVSSAAQNDEAVRAKDSLEVEAIGTSSVGERVGVGCMPLSIRRHVGQRVLRATTHSSHSQQPYCL